MPTQAVATPQKTVESAKYVKAVPTVSRILPKGEIVELVHRPEQADTSLIVWDGGEWRREKEIKLSDTEKLIPYSAHNNLIQNGVILLPSEPEEYGSEASLLADIQDYIHRYIDVSPLYEKIASYYVLLSWIYDGFNELPYLRLRGEPGSGKTRFLQTVGSICYKPIFASGASSVSPMFRILDAVRGTLIIDESDFSMSDEKSEIIKIFNNGNVKGFPVLRSEISINTKEFNPKAYHVFGPKLIANRGFFEDRALESRCLTEEMGQRKMREDIPINLPDAYKVQALHLRNKLLLFRFRNYGLRGLQGEVVDRTIEPRLNQIFTPLISIINDPIAKQEIKELAKVYHEQMISERGMDIEAQLLEIIRDLIAANSRCSVKDITGLFIRLHGQESERRITPKYIGGIIRGRLGLRTRKSQGIYVIQIEEQPKLTRLYERFGIEHPGHSQLEVPKPGTSTPSTLPLSRDSHPPQDA